LVENEYDALKNADALIIATEWAEFKSPDFNKIKKLLNKSTIFDGRNIYNPTQMEDEGFEYYSIGRGKNIK
jgi:UDPglucose 6-dehydrogenase